MWMVLLAAAAFAGAQAQTAPPAMSGPDGKLDSRLAAAGLRVANIAERFSDTAQQYVGREVLEQRVIRRGAIRKAKGNAIAPGSTLEYDHRRIVSLYSFTTVSRSPAIREIRQVLMVDKDKVIKEAEGRNLFRTALLRRDDEVKGQLLNQFEPEALSGVATNLGQMILLFDKSGMRNYAFEYDRQEALGGGQAMVVSYAQRRGREGVHIDEGGKKMKGDLRGWLWVRLPDYLPLRITMVTAHTLKKQEVRDEAEVDYAENTNGVLLPTTVIHRRWENDVLVAEDYFQYSEWQTLQ